MRIIVRFSVDSLPAHVREEVCASIETSTDNVFAECPGCGFLTYDENTDSMEKDMSNNTEAEALDFCKRLTIPLKSVFLLETSILDERSVKPARGVYHRGESTATVDSYVESKSTGVFPILKVTIDGTNLQSAVDLYHLIRQGIIEPDEWWDKKPVPAAE